MCIEAPSFATVRETRQDAPMAVSPSRAIGQVGRRLTRVLEAHGPHAIGLCLAEAVSPETQYLATKFAHGTLRSARLFCDPAAALAAVERGHVHALWLFDADILEDSLWARRSLLNADLIVLQHDALALDLPVDVFFPALRRSASGGGAAKPDWWWIQQVALAMGFRAGLGFTSMEQIRDEILREA
jgi:predicted molibdopterin-dependent oxidoreductase YjgC